MTTAAIATFADDVGAEGAVAVEGGRTRWSAGGEPASDTRLVRAPTGIVEYQPDEMTVRVGAGTTVADLHQTLGEHKQCTSLPERPGGTVGGALMVGESSLHRLGWGHVRDALLQAVYVGADGNLVTAGGPTVKNVSGFDLCRALVGSLGTLGLVADVILRTRPIPPARQWLTALGFAPWPAPQRLLTATAVLWDGAATWVHLEGHGGDVDAEAAAMIDEGFAPTGGPPELPPHRWSMAPSDLRSIDRADTGAFVAEVGVGTLHAQVSQPRRELDPRVAELNARVKTQFDPTGRLNPGRSVV